MNNDTTSSHDSNGRRGARRRAGLVALLVAGAATAGVGGSARAQDTGSCAVEVNGPISADAAERQVTHCLDVRDEVYVECMRSVTGSPDTLERWVGYCRAQADA